MSEKRVGTPDLTVVEPRTDDLALMVVHRLGEGWPKGDSNRP
jgi:hypothetical protein